MPHPDVSAILTAHAEGPMAGLTLRSLADAVAFARREGLTIEVLVVLDNPTAATSSALSRAAELGAHTHSVSYADQGLVRNHAVELATGEYVAFLDADDLWSENWLVDAHRTCLRDPGRVIAHPEVNWFFDASGNAFFPGDQLDPAFDPAFLRIANYWDALCMAPVAAHREHPFSKRAIADGFAYEDWHWNMETVVGGFVHTIAPETIHFKRRRRSSQTIEATANKSLTRFSDFLDYDWFAQHHPSR